MTVEVIAAIAAVVAAIGTYLEVRRRLSGSIQTSEASTLWQESTALRKRLDEELAVMRSQIEKMAEEMAALGEELRSVTQERDALAEENLKLRDRIRDLEQRVDDLAAARGARGPRGLPGDRG